MRGCKTNPGGRSFPDLEETPWLVEIVAALAALLLCVTGDCLGPGLLGNVT